jgi:hypothetical protein
MMFIAKVVTLLPLLKLTLPKITVDQLEAFHTTAGASDKLGSKLEKGDTSNLVY